MTLDDLRALEAQVTPGPWEPGDGNPEETANHVANVRGLDIWGPYRAVSCGQERQFIVELRNKSLLLLDLGVAVKLWLDDLWPNHPEEGQIGDKCEIPDCAICKFKQIIADLERP